MCIEWGASDSARQPHVRFAPQEDKVQNPAAAKILHDAGMQHSIFFLFFSWLIQKQILVCEN